VVTRLSDLNYVIVDQQNKKLVVHVNRLKPNYNPQTWKLKFKQRGTKKLPKEPTSYQEEKQEDEQYLGMFPLRREIQLQSRTSPDQIPSTPEPDSQPADISFSENTDPNYETPETPISGENYRIHAKNPLLQDNEIGLFFKNYSLIHTKN
jgi:hypothetical protein